MQMLTIGRNVLSDPTKIIQSARFVQEEVGRCTGQERLNQQQLSARLWSCNLQCAVNAERRLVRWLTMNCEYETTVHMCCWACTAAAQAPGAPPVGPAAAAVSSGSHPPAVVANQLVRA
jgi:hypothetical protein